MQSLPSSPGLADFLDQLAGHGWQGGSRQRRFPVRDREPDLPATLSVRHIAQPQGSCATSTVWRRG